MNVRSNKLRAGLGVCLVAALIAGCGDSDDDKTAGGDTGPKPTFKGKPIVIATSSPLQSPGGDYPGPQGGTRAAARAINAAGGIQGHELKVITCNTKADPNIELACARKAGGSGAIATTGNLYFRNNYAVMEQFEKDQIPSVSATSPLPVDFQSKMAFPTDFSVGSQTPCAAPAMAKETGEDKFSIVNVDNAPGNSNALLATGAAQIYKAGPAGQIKVPESTTDFAPILPDIESKGTSRLLVSLAPPQIAGFLVAAGAAGKDWSVCSADTVSADTLSKAGAGAKKYYVAQSLPPKSEAATNPEIARFLKEMKAEEDSGDDLASTDAKTYSSMALRAWLGVQVVKQVADKMTGDINNKTFLAALKTAKVDLKVVPPLDFTKAQSSGLFTRVFNPELTISKWDPDKKDFFTVKSVGSVNGLEAIR